MLVLVSLCDPCIGLTGITLLRCWRALGLMWWQQRQSWRLTWVSLQHQSAFSVWSSPLCGHTRNRICRSHSGRFEWLQCSNVWGASKGICAHSHSCCWESTLVGHANTQIWEFYTGSRLAATIQWHSYQNCTARPCSCCCLCVTVETWVSQLCSVRSLCSQGPGERQAPALRCHGSSICICV